MTECPCGTGRDESSCCGLYLDREQLAPTAEALMRSRYTAFTRARIDYITETHDPSTRANHDEEGARAWAEGSEWRGLEIVSTDGGETSDDWGKVEFIARFKNDDGEQEHHEISTFSKRDGRWYFTTGEVLGPQQVRRSAPKTGRNDPCPCGSGKKYKKCCG